MGGGKSSGALPALGPRLFAGNPQRVDQREGLVVTGNMMSTAPKINPIDISSPRPFWSVMIPTYNPQKDYLEQTLRSVLSQDPGPEQMQIEVVDDCSPKVDVAALVREIAGDRVKVSQTPKNLGLAGCWNSCIERSLGRWVHILHQDDYLLPGFYTKLKQAAEQHSEAALLATRSFFVDEDDVILGVTERLPELEKGGHKVDGFFYSNPIMCPGIVVRRSFYETHGGFLAELVLTLDAEMWARAIGLGGGVVTSEVLSYFRLSKRSETGRLARTAEDLRDIERCNELFAGRYPDFSQGIAKERLLYMARDHAYRFSKLGDIEAEAANSNYWKKNAPLLRRWRRLAGKLKRRFLAKA
jgi:glycosyltransferase involved in cell wall biosynthesis